MLEVSLKPNIQTGIAKQQSTRPKSLLLARNTDCVSFGYESPLKDIAKHCAYCGIEMIPDPDVDKFAQRIQNLSGFKLQSQLKEIMYKFPPDKQNTTNYKILVDLLKISSECPDMKGNAVIKKYIDSKNKEFHSKIDSEKEKKDEVFNNLLQLKPLLPPYTRTLIDNIIKLEPALLLTRLHAVHTIKNMSEKEGLTLPEEFMNYYKYTREEETKLKSQKLCFVYNKSGPEEFAKQLLRPIRITLEHVKPHSKEGKDHTYNYLPVCGECNEERGNIDFPDVVKANPKLGEYITRSLKEVKHIIAGLLRPDPELQDYIQQITSTIRRESNGQLNIVV